MKDAGGYMCSREDLSDNIHPQSKFFAHIHGGIYFTERRISRDTCLE